MDLNLLFDECLGNYAGCFVVEADVDTKATDGTRDLLFIEIHEVTQDEIDEFNESSDDEDLLDDIDESFFVLSISRGHLNYTQTVVERRCFRTRIDEYLTFESAFNEVKSVLKDFLEHYDLNSTSSQVSTRCDDEYEECHNAIIHLVEHVTESQKNGKTEG